MFYLFTQSVKSYDNMTELKIRILYASRKNDGKTLIEQRSLERWNLHKDAWRMTGNYSNGSN